MNLRRGRNTRSLSLFQELRHLSGNWNTRRIRPEATTELFKRIVDLIPAKRDLDHLRIIIDNNPKIPDRTAAIIGEGNSPLPLLIETAKNL